MRTEKKIPHFSSDEIAVSKETVDIGVPSCWDDLDDCLLHYVFSLRGTMPSNELKVCLFLRSTGTRILGEFKDGFAMSNTENETFFMPLTVLAEIVETMRWLELPPYFRQPRILEFEGYEHIDPLLKGEPFSTYLRMENLWTAILINYKSPRILHELFTDLDKIVYSKSIGAESKPRERKVVETALACWMQDLRSRFYSKYPYLFRQAADAGGEFPSAEAVMNAEIRALTGGDITKEDAVLKSDTWRALTELNEKAREAQEYKDKIK